MRFELLLVPDCRHEAGAADLFRSSLTAAGLSNDFSTMVVDDPATAHRLNFTGSPSFFANGRDLLPADREAAIACRLYVTNTGLAGLPDQQAMVDAIQAVTATS